MLRRILIASAAAAMLLVTFTPDDAFARRGGGGSALEVSTAAAACERRLPRRRGRSSGMPGRCCRCARRALRLSGWGLSRLRRLSRLRCRCGGSGRGCGRSRCGGGLPQWLRLRRLRQLDLPGRVPSVLSGTTPLAWRRKANCQREAFEAFGTIGRPGGPFRFGDLG